MESAPSVLSGAVALMSLSVKSSLAEAMLAKGDRAVALGGRDGDGVALDPGDFARDLLGAVLRLGEADPRLMPGPVGKVLEPGQRAVDAGRADLEPVAAGDRVAARFLLGVEHVGQAPRQRLAIGDVELARLAPLGHHLQCRIARPADHRHAHEVEAEGLGLGLDQGRQSGKIGHDRPLHGQNVSRTGAAWAPASGIWRCRGEAIDIGASPYRAQADEMRPPLVESGWPGATDPTRWRGAVKRGE